MKKVSIFLDSSALIAGVISENGAAHVLLQLGETEDISLTISELVFNETTRSIGRKSPENLANVQKEIEKARIIITQDPSYEEIQANLYLMDDPDDVPILLAAIKAKADYLATHDSKHFLNDPKVAEKAGLKIGTPGDVLAWIRENLCSQ
ncbi:MAG: putative toxin-antitoxin system toxin component, PIN family [Anaerolineales bacterium]|nr:putative toxin-antitoxin system toxin component, PIN family [Anaerolineales bacterium]WKZ40916.1 MAG: putative toxin-antitoxin system toxin component, PIN family [Anaerolineales bacterium]